MTGWRDEDEYQARLVEAAKRLEEYRALPAIKRIERWYAYTAGSNISEAFRLLGEALEEWAKEQQSK